MDPKLLATIIAVAKKEAGAQSRDLSAIEAKVEAKLKEFHKRSPILETPEFFVKSGCLHCKWQSGLELNFGNIVGPQGPQGVQGIQGPAGLLESWDDGTNVFLKFYTKFAAPVDLSPNGNDRYEFVVQDDLSSLIEFNVRADAAIVTRPNGEAL